MSTAGLAAAASELGVGLSQAQAETLAAYLEHLYFWNRRQRLTSIAAADAPRLHLLDSLAVAPWLGSARSIADLGSGAGLPGIPLATVLAETAFTLVESKRRRSSFLREMVRELGLPNVSIREADVATLVREGLRFEAVVARAFRPPLSLVSLGAPLLCSGGCLVIMGGGSRATDIDEAVASVPGLSLETEHFFRLPGGDEERGILVLRAA